MTNRRGVTGANRVYMSTKQVQALVLQSVERVKPEHDTGAARVLRRWMEREVGLDPR